MLRRVPLMRLLLRLLLLPPLVVLRVHLRWRLLLALCDALATPWLWPPRWAKFPEGTLVGRSPELGGKSLRAGLCLRPQVALRVGCTYTCEVRAINPEHSGP